MTVIAAIYSPVNRDPFFHAQMGCTHGKIRIREGGSYNVTTMERAIHQGKFPCPDCWEMGGYVVAVEKVRVR